MGIKTILRPVVMKLARVPFVDKAIAEEADLSAFAEPPSLKIVLGVAAILFSYVIGWPAVSVMGAAAVYFDQPLIAIVGGPLVYGLSHLVFLAGMALAGAEYSVIFLRWATRVLVAKLLDFVS